MDGDRAVADRSDGQQTTIEGEHFVDPQSGLPAFRYLVDRNQVTHTWANYNMLLSDRYALHIPFTEQLETIDVYDLKMGVRR